MDEVWSFSLLAREGLNASEATGDPCVCHTAIYPLLADPKGTFHSWCPGAGGGRDSRNYLSEWKNIFPKELHLFIIFMYICE